MAREERSWLGRAGQDSGLSHSGGWAGCWWWLRLITPILSKSSTSTSKVVATQACQVCQVCSCNL